MATITEVIRRLEQLKAEHGDVDVRIVNYHSDYFNCEIESIEDAVRFQLPQPDGMMGFTKVDYVIKPYVLIGGESY